MKAGERRGEPGRPAGEIGEARSGISALQARQALAVKLPRAEQAGREAPKALSSGQYSDLLRAAKAAIADDPLAGARDLAIVLVLGDGCLRCEELAGLQRVDFVAARKGAKLRALEVRHGKGDRGRTVKLSERASRAIVRWERERAANAAASSSTRTATARCDRAWGSTPAGAHTSCRGLAFRRCRRARHRSRAEQEVDPFSRPCDHRRSRPHRKRCRE